MKALMVKLFVIVAMFMLAITPASAKTIKLRAHNATSPQAIFVKEMLVPWSKMIEERTAALGQPVEISVFTGSAIVPFGQHYRALLKGTIDIASNVFSDLLKDQGGVIDVLHLPFLFKNTKAVALTALDLYDKYPEFRDPFTQAKLMWFQPTAPANVIFSNKPIEKLEDLKGLTVFTSDAAMNRIYSAFGCVPMDVPFTEIYTALDRGLLNFITKDWEAAMAFKFFEVTSDRTILPIGTQPSFMCVSMNWDSWKALPPEVQKVFEELNGRYMTEYTAQHFDAAVGKLQGIIRGIDQKSHKTYHTLSAAEFERWKEKVKPVYAEWVKEMEAKGLPGRAIFEDAKKLGEKYAQ